MNLSENFYRVTFSSNERYIVSNIVESKSAVISGKLRNIGDIPVVGDYVYGGTSEGDVFVIDGIVERQGALRRKKPSSEHGFQLIASNVTTLLMVAAMDENFSVNRLERFMVMAADAGVETVVALTKADLAEPQKRAMCQFETEERLPDAKVICTSVVTHEGIKELRELFKPQSTICLAGISGAGKSSLINELTGENLQSTKDVRVYDSKGRHTTTSRHMFYVGSFWIIDTPGIREVGVVADQNAVEDVFKDISSAAKLCRFSDCTHTTEPECEVQRLLKLGEIDEKQFENFIKLSAEAEKSSKSVKARNSERKKQGKALSKLVKSAYKHKKRF